MADGAAAAPEHCLTNGAVMCLHLACRPAAAPEHVFAAQLSPQTSVHDADAWRENHVRNQEIEKMLTNSYRVNARQAYAQQFLTNADPKVLALVKGA